MNKLVRPIHIKPVAGWEFPSLVEIWRLRELLFIMVVSNLRGKYRQSIFSMVYLFIQPLFSVGIFTFIFAGLAKIETGAIPYPLFSFIGVTTWNFFNRTANEGNSSLVAMAPILSKVYIPRLLVVSVTLITQFIEYIIAFSLISIFFLFYGILPTLNIIFLPIAILPIVLFSVSIILWLSNLNVRFRDVSMLLPGVIQVLFFATPVVYPLNAVPSKWQWLIQLNPMTNFFEIVRFCIFTNYPFPDKGYLVFNLLTVALLLIPGLLIFNKYSKTMVDRL